MPTRRKRCAAPSRSVGAGRSWAQKSLVIAQVAMSLVLLSAAALLGQSLRNLEHQNFGFETQGRYIAWINPMLGNYKPEQMEPMFRQIDDRLLQIPGVRMVAPALYAPMTGDSWNDGIRIEGRPEPAAKEDTGAGWARVMPGFFETIGAKIVLGRPIDGAGHRGDAQGGGDQRSVRQEILQRPEPDRAAFRARQDQVFRNLRNRRRHERHALYDLRLQESGAAHVLGAGGADRAVRRSGLQSGEIWSHYLYNIVIWAPGNPPGMEERVRKALASVDPNLVLYGVDPYDKGGERGFPAGEHDCDADHALSVRLGWCWRPSGCTACWRTWWSGGRARSACAWRWARIAGRVVGMVLGGAFWQVASGWRWAFRRRSGRAS